MSDCWHFETGFALELNTPSGANHQQSAALFTVSQSTFIGIVMLCKHLGYLSLCMHLEALTPDSQGLCVHSALFFKAARNCLVGEKFQVKVGDFGLAR